MQTQHAQKRGPLGGFFDWIDRLPRRQDLRALARCFAEHVNKRGEAWPSHKRLADMAVMSRDTVRELLNEMIALGFLADTGRRIGRAWAKVRVLRVVGFEPAEWQTWGDEALELPPVDNQSVQATADTAASVDNPPSACPPPASCLPSMEGRNREHSLIPEEANKPEQPNSQQPLVKTKPPANLMAWLAARKRGVRNVLASVGDVLSSGFQPGDSPQRL
jgi:hypothetical protein